MLNLPQTLAVPSGPLWSFAVFVMVLCGPLRNLVRPHRVMLKDANDANNANNMQNSHTGRATIASIINYRLLCHREPVRTSADPHFTNGHLGGRFFVDSIWVRINHAPAAPASV